MTQYPPPAGWQPPDPNQSSAGRPRKKRPAWLLPVGIGVVILLVGLGIGGAAGSAGKKTVAAPTVSFTMTHVSIATVTATATPTQVISTQQVTTTVTFTPQPVSAFSDGTFIVGSDVQPGTYKTAGDGSECYYALLRSADTQDIITNNLSSGPMIMQVTSRDFAVETHGGCSWAKA